MNCNVCRENVEIIWNSYGGENICQSCRVFFFRSVQSSAYQAFERQKCDNECVIQSKNRKSCKRCRFQKCVSIGMKVSFVRTNTTQLEKPLRLDFNSDNQKEMLAFWNKVWIGPFCTSTFRMLASSEKHLLSQFTAPFTSPNWSMSEREEALAFYHHIDLQEMKSYALTYSQMENLSSHDAFTLFKHNYYRMSLFRRVLIMSSVSIIQESNRIQNDHHKYTILIPEWIVDWFLQVLFCLWWNEQKSESRHWLCPNKDQWKWQQLFFIM